MRNFFLICKIFIVTASIIISVLVADKIYNWPEGYAYEKYVQLRLQLHYYLKGRNTFEPLKRVAHAGGAFKEFTGISSITALNENADRFELFELDLLTTSDGGVVCLHDWQTASTVLGSPASASMTLQDFNDAVKRQILYKNCTLETISEWLKKHPTKKIITDVKDQNFYVLKLISETIENSHHKIIPQIYSPEEYDKVRELGFESIIWTLYRYPENSDNVLLHLMDMDLFAVTMDKVRARNHLAKKIKRYFGVASYVHTVNSQEELEEFLKLGVSEIYTDILY